MRDVPWADRRFVVNVHWSVLVITVVVHLGLATMLPGTVGRLPGLWVY